MHDGSRLGRLVFGFLLTVTVILVPCIAQSQETTASTTSCTNTETEAVSMREDIRRAYEELKAFRELTGSMQGNDIHTVMARYIKRGMNFKAAEDLLRQAGFKVSPRLRASVASNRPGRYNIYAKSDKLIKNDAFWISNEVVITLNPDSPRTYSKVASISAHIYVISI